MEFEVCDALRFSGSHTCYTDRASEPVLRQYIVNVNIKFGDNYRIHVTIYKAY